MLKIAILASGAGTNAQAIIDKIEAGVLDAEIVLLIANRPGAPVLDRAERRGIPALLIDHTLYADRESFDLAMLRPLAASRCELVVLAGYMRLLSARFLNEYRDRIINIHPALLPSFPGLRGAADALAYGVKLTGPSVHFVEKEMDRGPLIIQGAVPCDASDDLESLSRKIRGVEHRIYPQAIQWLAQGRIRREGRRVFLADADVAKAPPEPETLIWPPLEAGF